MNQARRSQDLMMSQIENQPGGFNALRRLYTVRGWAQGLVVLDCCTVYTGKRRRVEGGTGCCLAKTASAAATGDRIERVVKLSKVSLSKHFSWMDRMYTVVNVAPVDSFPLSFSQFCSRNVATSRVQKSLMRPSNMYFMGKLPYISSSFQRCKLYRLRASPNLLWQAA